MTAADNPSRVLIGETDCDSLFIPNTPLLLPVISPVGRMIDLAVKKMILISRSGGPSVVFINEKYGKERAVHFDFRVFDGLLNPVLT